MEVLTGIGALFGSRAGAGAANAAGGTGATNTPMTGVGLLQPDILAQAKDLTGGASTQSNPIFSQNLLQQIGDLNQKAQQNLRTALPMMQLNQMQQPQIQQTDLVNLLKNLGGY